jgi:HPt (histidine-containing phosphotransfer) domain-containing protein
VIYQEIALVDQTRLQELRSMDDDGTFLNEIITLFASDSESSITEIKSTLAANDLAQMKKVAHRLKGSALSLGANRFAALASDIEHDLDPASIKESVARLESLREETINELGKKH